jgi:hypothetical protein
LRHYGLCLVAKEAEQLIDQSALSGISRNHNLEDIGVADFLHTAQGPLLFQPVNGFCRMLLLLLLSSC